MIDDNLIWLIKWYYDQCNWDWKRGMSFSIGTIDNPGWDLWVYLDDTDLADKPFHEISIDRSEHDWVRCYIKNNKFTGVGGPFNLPEIVQIFRDWIESCQKNDSNSDTIKIVQSQEVFNISFLGETKSNDNFLWLVQWFYSQCNGCWEHGKGIYINSIESGWYLTISIKETELEDLQFQEVNIDRSQNDWIQCFLRDMVYDDRQFNGVGGPLNLPELIHVFRKWAESF